MVSSTSPVSTPHLLLSKVQYCICSGKVALQAQNHGRLTNLISVKSITGMVRVPSISVKAGARQYICDTKLMGQVSLVLIQSWSSKSTITAPKITPFTTFLAFGGTVDDINLTRGMTRVALTQSMQPPVTERRRPLQFILR